MVSTPTVTDYRFFTRALLAWGRANRRTFPWREESNPFKILIAEVLLQRSRAITVARVHQDLFKRWPDAEHLARARVDTIAKVIRPVGLTRRAATLRALAIAVVAHNGVPTKIDALMELPGVGRYAAHATAAVAFGRHVPTVDGVSARVYRRFFGYPADLPAADDPQLWDLVERTTPKAQVRAWNWAVLDHAAGVCLPKVPRCSGCPLQRHCAWSQAHQVFSLS